MELPAWYSRKLEEVRDTVHYDSHGIASSYPWLRYDVNERYPQVQEVWRIQEHANIASGFARDGKHAWYATTSGSVRCIDIRNGNQLWYKDFPGKIFSTPSVSGKYLVFGCTDGCIYALEARSGRIMWTAQAGKPNRYVYRQDGRAARRHRRRRYGDTPGTDASVQQAPNLFRQIER